MGPQSRKVDLDDLVVVLAGVRKNLVVGPEVMGYLVRRVSGCFAAGGLEIASYGVVVAEEACGGASGAAGAIGSSLGSVMAYSAKNLFGRREEIVNLHGIATVVCAVMAIEKRYVVDIDLDGISQIEFDKITRTQID